jgi:hypothetical protein
VGVQNKRTLASFSPGKLNQWKQAATLNGRPYIVGHVPRGLNYREEEFEGPLRGNNSSTRMISLGCDEICSAIVTALQGQLHPTLDALGCWTRNLPRSVSFPFSACLGSCSLTHRQTDQAKEKAEKKVCLCILLTKCIANHVGRKQPLHASPPPSEPIRFKFCREPKSRPTGTSASTRPCSCRFEGINNSVIDVHRWDSNQVE